MGMVRFPYYRRWGKTMIKKNEFQSFCEELSECVINKVDYVRTQLRAKYKDNLDQLLAIKAEAQENDYIQFLTIRVSILALVTSIFSVISNLIPKTNVLLIDSGISLIFLSLLIFTFACIGIGDKFISTHKWRKYILVVIDDIIVECKQAKEDQTKGNKKRHKK